MMARPLALAALLALSGCVLLVDDPEGWTAPEGSGGAAGAQGSGGPGANLCLISGGYCSCDGGDDATGCSEQAIGDAVCCAELDYPAANTSCRCERFTCKTTTSGCECRISSTHGPWSTCSPDFDQICCRTLFGCECGRPADVSCQEGDDDNVPSCSPAVPGCFDARRVLSCQMGS